MIQERLTMEMELPCEGCAPARPAAHPSRPALLITDVIASLCLATFTLAMLRFAATVIVEIIFMLLTLSFIICVLKRK